jgi:hypothetical protein
MIPVLVTDTRDGVVIRQRVEHFYSTSPAADAVEAGKTLKTRLPNRTVRTYSAPEFCECCGLLPNVCDCYGPLSDQEEAAAVAFYEHMHDDRNT